MYRPLVRRGIAAIAVSVVLVTGLTAAGPAAAPPAALPAPSGCPLEPASDSSEWGSCLQVSATLASPRTSGETVVLGFEVRASQPLDGVTVEAELPGGLAWAAQPAGMRTEVGPRPGPRTAGAWSVPWRSVRWPPTGRCGSRGRSGRSPPDRPRSACRPAPRPPGGRSGPGQRVRHRRGRGMPAAFGAASRPRPPPRRRTGAGRAARRPDPARPASAARPATWTSARRAGPAAACGWRSGTTTATPLTTGWRSAPPTTRATSWSASTTSIQTATIAGRTPTRSSSPPMSAGRCSVGRAARSANRTSGACAGKAHQRQGRPDRRHRFLPAPQHRPRMRACGPLTRPTRPGGSSPATAGTGTTARRTWRRIEIIWTPHHRNLLPARGRRGVPPRRRPRRAGHGRARARPCGHGRPLRGRLPGHRQLQPPLSRASARRGALVGGVRRVVLVRRRRGPEDRVHPGGHDRPREPHLGDGRLAERRDRRGARGRRPDRPVRRRQRAAMGPAEHRRGQWRGGVEPGRATALRHLRGVLEAVGRGRPGRVRRRAGHLVPEHDRPGVSRPAPGRRLAAAARARSPQLRADHHPPRLVGGGPPASQRRRPRPGAVRRPGPAPTPRPQPRGRGQDRLRRDRLQPGPPAPPPTTTTRR